MNQTSFSLSKFVAIFGGIYMIYQGILRIISLDLNTMLLGLFGIFLACLLIISTGIVKIRHKIPWHWGFLLVIGIITIWVCWISALIVLIAALLLYKNY